MKRLGKYSVLLFIVVAVGLFSCDKDDDPSDPMSARIETITTFRLLLFPGMSQPFQISYRDIDADGPDDPIIVSGTLSANTIHRGELSLFDETVIPELDIKDAINSDGVNYQVFYVGNGIDITVNYTDQDVNGNPIGLNTEITAGNAASGSITIIVRYQPTKNVSNNPDIAGGTTVAEVTIPVDIQ